MLWLIFGLVLGWVVSLILNLSLTHRIKVRWYQWVLGVIATVLILLTIQNYLALQAELEPAAAGLMWFLFGLPGIILAALIWVIPWFASVVSRPRVSNKATAEKA